MRSTKGSRGSYTQTNSFTFFAKEENIKENNMYLLYYVFTLSLWPGTALFFLIQWKQKKKLFASKTKWRKK